MRIRKALVALSLAGAISTSSCIDWKYVGMSAYRKYDAFAVEFKRRRARRNALLKKYFSPNLDAKVTPQRRYTCEKGMVLPGGLKTHAYVFLQTHQDSITEKSHPPTAHSQITIFRVLQYLAKRKGIKVVIREGFYNTDFFDPKENKKNISVVKKIFRKCVSKVMSRIRGEKRNLPKQKEAEDICLINFYVPTGLSNAYYAPLFLLMSEHPGLRNIGFEKKSSAYSKWMKSLDKQSKSQPKQDDEETSQDFNFQGIKRFLDGWEKMKKEEDKTEMPNAVRETIPSLSSEQLKRLIGRLISDSIYNSKNELKEQVKYWHKHGKYFLEQRSAIAVESIVSHASQNSAVLIGSNHFFSMVVELVNVPHDKRPTVHFLEDQCTNRDSFVTPVERMMPIVDLLVGKP
jgi:hypothetical protein